jgi:hypothetical protein
MGFMTIDEAFDICGLDLGHSFFRIEGKNVCLTCRDMNENTGGLVCLRRRYAINNMRLMYLQMDKVLEVSERAPTVRIKSKNWP